MDCMSAFSLYANMYSLPPHSGRGRGLIFTVKILFGIIFNDSFVHSRQKKTVNIHHDAVKQSKLLSHGHHTHTHTRSLTHSSRPITTTLKVSEVKKKK